MVYDGSVPTPHVLATLSCTAGEWSTTQDLSGLADMTLTASVTQSNASGNTPSGNTRNATKDTIIPTASVTYSTTLPTNANVIATLTGASESIVVTNNMGFTAMAFASNGTGSFEFSDTAGNTNSIAVAVDNIDTDAPVAAVVTAIPTYTNDTTPTIVISSTELADPTFSGSCTSGFGQLGAGNNSITLDTLAQGTYSDCSIVLTDAVGNASTPLVLPTFTVDTSVVNLYSVKAPSVINPSNVSSVYFTGLVASDAGATVNWSFRI